MARQTVISLVGVAIGAGLLGVSSASAAPANGVVIGKAASAGELTEKVIWRGYGWRPGWRAGWRGWGWRPGLAAAGVAAAAAYGASNYGYNNYPYDNYASNNYSYGYGDQYSYSWRPGWRVAAANQNYNYGYGSGYGYATNYNSGPYYGQGTYWRPGLGAAAYAANQSYNYGYGSNYNSGNFFGQGNYSQPSVAAATTAPTAASSATSGEAAAPAPRARPTRYTRGYCINAVRERFGISATDAGKPTNAAAVQRCLEGGPMKIG
jgi:hypothetical protein